MPCHLFKEMKKNNIHVKGKCQPLNDTIENHISKTIS